MWRIDIYPFILYMYDNLREHNRNDVGEQLQRYRRDLLYSAYRRVELPYAEVHEEIENDA